MVYFAPALALILLFILLAVPLVVLVWAATVWRLEHAADRVPVLCYHRLTSQADLDSGKVVDDEPVWTVVDTDFEQHCRHLRDDGWTTLDLNDLIQIHRGEQPAPSKPIVLTFDDGYHSVMRLGAPILRKYGQKAVVYACLDPDEHTRKGVEGKDRIMTADELAELSRQGIAIESHTVTHCMLTEKSDADAKWELAESRKRIAEITGKPCDHFCVPRGGHDARVVRLVRDEGYLTCSGLSKGTARLSADPMKLPRIAVERYHDLPRFRKILSPKHASVHRMLGTLRVIPTRILGARAGYKLRQVLYSPALRPIFGPRNLLRLVAVAGLGWAATTAWLLLRVVQ